MITEKIELPPGMSLKPSALAGYWMSRARALELKVQSCREEARRCRSVLRDCRKHLSGNGGPTELLAELNRLLALPPEERQTILEGGE
jgi:hypothetical protein